MTAGLGSFGMRGQLLSAAGADGLGVEPLTVAASASIPASDWSVGLVLDNPANAFAVGLALALGGADASKVALYHAASLPDAITEPGVGLVEVEEVAVPAEASTTLWLARAPGETGAITDCTLTLTDEAGTPYAVEITASALQGGLAQAVADGFSTFYSFPAGAGNIPFADQIGAADLSAAAASWGAPVVRGTEGFAAITGAGALVGSSGAPDRAGDRTLLYVFELTAQPSAAHQLFCLADAYNTTTMLAQLNWITTLATDPINGANEFGSSPGGGNALQLVGPGAAGVWVSTNGIQFGDRPIECRTDRDVIGVVYLLVFTFEHASGTWTAWMMREGDADLTEIATATIGTSSSGGGAFRIGSNGSSVCPEHRVHALGWKNGTPLTLTQLRRYPLLYGLRAPKEA